MVGVRLYLRQDLGLSKQSCFLSAFQHKMKYPAVALSAHVHLLYHTLQWCPKRKISVFCSNNTQIISAVLGIYSRMYMQQLKVSRIEFLNRLILNLWIWQNSMHYSDNTVNDHMLERPTDSHTCQTNISTKY